ncbi:MAG: glycosyltransferase family 9 protein [Sphingobacteriaceae bacterium]|nr:glycosyltransferase family 9 protein [Sphingobacteriaceae bacterium]
MPSRGKIIVLRFSAMGDVAMVASVLQELVAQNSGAELIMVSRAAFKPFFDGLKNVTFHAIEPRTIHKGISGLYKLHLELKKYNPVAIADLHDNIRSRVLCLLFRMAGVKIRRIDKGRKEKKELTRSVNKIFKQLKQTVERYADVFRAFSLNLTLSHRLVSDKKQIPTKAENLFNVASTKKIGISPFAQHIYKVYALTNMEAVIAELNNLGYDIFIFGGGKEEQLIAENWQDKYKNVNSLIGNFSLTEELAIISNLDIMLSMDSAGMHMSSLMGVPVVSIWGPTHPYAGFLGYGQQESDCLQIDNPIRPNSIYGNKPCLCYEIPCIDLVTPESILNKIKQKLKDA